MDEEIKSLLDGQPEEDKDYCKELEYSRELLWELEHQ